ncbi:hypothetical protein ABE493_12465 [Stenotrophomonas terrae]|uniref:hypothetical protein n=1 Tax=Stenotrophomonas terrae TaxID=405446 RepID=UPI003208438C
MTTAGWRPTTRRAALLLRLGLLSTAVLAFPALAQQPVPAAVAEAYAPATGDAWVDRQLADINAYAARYPEAFVDELARYAGARPGYVQALLQDHGWKPGDVYLACFWGRLSGSNCRPAVKARAQQPDASWKEVLAGLQPPPDNLRWRALRHAIVASFDHWDRPITLDPLLQRQLGDRAQREAAARKDAGE